MSYLRQHLCHFFGDVDRCGNRVGCGLVDIIVYGYGVGGAFLEGVGESAEEAFPGLHHLNGCSFVLMGLCGLGVHHYRVFSAAQIAHLLVEEALMVVGSQHSSELLQVDLLQVEQTDEGVHACFLQGVLFQRLEFESLRLGFRDGVVEFLPVSRCFHIDGTLVVAHVEQAVHQAVGHIALVGIVARSLVDVQDRLRVAVYERYCQGHHHGHGSIS